jgi:hypothetical protein
LHHKTFRTFHFEGQLTLPHIVDAEVFIEQANERADGAAGVVVFGFAEQQGAAAFKVAKVHIIAQCGADHFTAGVRSQDDFGFRVVPLAGRVDAHPRTGPHCAHGLGFGENFSVGPDAHL